MAYKPSHKRQKLKATEKSKDKQCARTKEGKDLIPLTVGNYFTHNPFNVAFMQIVKSNNNKKSKTSISCQCNLPLYSKN
jgi:hypothetical protein